MTVENDVLYFSNFKWSLWLGREFTCLLKKFVRKSRLIGTIQLYCMTESVIHGNWHFENTSSLFLIYFNTQLMINHLKNIFSNCHKIRLSIICNFVSFYTQIASINHLLSFASHCNYIKSIKLETADTRTIKKR